jgi:multidrug transporter EmrE-like cation transporter
MTSYIFALLCIVGLAAGQILFKMSAEALSTGASPLTLRAAWPFLAAVCLYGITSVAWAWLLQRIELGRVYPLMGLAFVLVPLGSHLVFGERFPPQYFIGVVLIVIGIVVAARA